MGRSRRWVAALLMSGLLASAPGASAATSDQLAADPQRPNAHAAASSEVQTLSDSELTDMAADWDALDTEARADLIQETRGRMQPTADRPAKPVARVDNIDPPAPTGRGQITRTERRRFGRLVRQPDGSVVRIETRVIRVQRADPQRAYGMGFERRRAAKRPVRPDTIQPGQADTPSTMTATHLPPSRRVLRVQDGGP